MNDEKKKLTRNEREKVLVSFYMTLESVEKIDDFIFYSKKRLPVEKRRKLSKSVFYEMGLKTALEEYNKKGEQSALWKAICELIID